MQRLNELNTEPGGEWTGQLSNAISLFGTRDTGLSFSLVDRSRVADSQMIRFCCFSFSFVASAESGSVHCFCPNQQRL